MSLGFFSFAGFSLIIRHKFIHNSGFSQRMTISALYIRQLGDSDMVAITMDFEFLLFLLAWASLSDINSPTKWDFPRE